jgi:hypothetical protein
MFCLLYSPKQKIVEFHAQKQIGKSHVYMFQYLTLYYIIKQDIDQKYWSINLNSWPSK